ncbi:hypothetical protein GA0070562_5104 [Micromonospora tulbaghiae]|uniref:Uncharacterized protein n=1 Tax=Micromonospora tulbaghiae TaxID=479978 RepID=A0ABY0KQR1_9ACTN|nr:hypothetical protein GA0070562_5104 [Micromonospora tulbaghiae]
MSKLLRDDDGVSGASPNRTLSDDGFVTRPVGNEHQALAASAGGNRGSGIEPVGVADRFAAEPRSGVGGGLK